MKVLRAYAVYNPADGYSQGSRSDRVCLSVCLWQSGGADEGAPGVRRVQPRGRLQPGVPV